MRRSPAPHHVRRIRSEIHVNVCTTLPENLCGVLFLFLPSVRKIPNMPVKGGGGISAIYFEYRHMQRDTRDPTLRPTLAQWNPQTAVANAPCTLFRAADAQREREPVNAASLVGECDAMDHAERPDVGSLVD